MKRLLAALGAIVFLFSAGLISTGAPIPLLTVASGCNEASQLLNCLNQVINTLNGGGQTGMVSLFTGGTASSGAIDAADPNPQPCTGSCILNATLGPGTSAGTGSQFTPVRLNAQRGVVSFLTPIGGISATPGVTGGQSSTLLVLNSFITTASSCQASVLSAPVTGGVTVMNMTPTVSLVNNLGVSVPALAINLMQNSLAAVATQTYAIGFWCQ